MSDDFGNGAAALAHASEGEGSMGRPLTPEAHLVAPHVDEPPHLLDAYVHLMERAQSMEQRLRRGAWRVDLGRKAAPG